MPRRFPRWRVGLISAFRSRRHQAATVSMTCSTCSFAVSYSRKVHGMAHARPMSSVALGPLTLLVSFSLFWFSDTIADPDLWGHIRFGQDMIRTGSIIQIDTYSYRTGGQPWINHEWLSELIFAGLYDRTGPTGLIVFKVLISLLLLGLCHAHLLRRGMGPFPSLLLLLLMSVPFRLGLGTIRPQIFTYLIFLIQLLLLERATTGREYWLWVLPILYAVWVNLHGGVLAGAGVLTIWVAVQIVERLRDNTRPRIRNLRAAIPVALLGAACGLALLFNPYRGALVEFLLRTATVPRPEIGEWSPLGLMSRPGQIYLILLAVGIAGLVGSGRRRTPQAIVILSTAAVLPLISQRHYPLFLLTLVVLAGEHIADVWNRWGSRTKQWSGPSSSIAVISIFLSLVLVGSSLPRFACIRVEPYHFTFPARAVAFLRQSGVRGNMAVPFRLGRVCPLASRAGTEGFDRRQARDGLLGRELSSIARLREGNGGLGSSAEDLDHGSGPGSDRVADGQLGEPYGGVGAALPGHLQCTLRTRRVSGSRPARGESDSGPR